jgi:hypothetical protein
MRCSIVLIFVLVPVAAAFQPNSQMLRRVYEEGLAKPKLAYSLTALEQQSRAPSPSFFREWPTHKSRRQHSGRCVSREGKLNGVRLKSRRGLAIFVSIVFDIVDVLNSTSTGIASTVADLPVISLSASAQILFLNEYAHAGSLLCDGSLELLFGHSFR